MPKFTPGPWHVGMKPGPMVYGPQGEQIVGINVLLDQPEVIANARLIAAAPEMYEALHKIRDQEQHGDNSAEAHMHDMADIARAILAMIEG